MEDKKPEYKVNFGSFKPGICIYGIDHEANEIYYQKAVVCPQIVVGYVIPNALNLKEINLNDKATIKQIILGSAIDHILLIGDLETEKLGRGKNLEGILCENMKNKGFNVVKVNNREEIKDVLKAHKDMRYKSSMDDIRIRLQKPFYAFIYENPSLNITFGQLQSKL